MKYLQGSIVVTVGDIVPAFLVACPGFAAPWEGYLASWSGESDRSVYNDVSIISDDIIERYEAGDVPEIGVAFTLVERYLAEGDEDTRQVITIALIEGIQAVASHRPFGPEAFERWPQPRSRVAWIIGAAAWHYEFALAALLRSQLGSAHRQMPDLSTVRSPKIRAMVERLYPR